jgi:hypothetical protein
MMAKSRVTGGYPQPATSPAITSEETHESDHPKLAGGSGGK